ncbi:hypothetical protein EV421DRAFT_2025573 [Armillaria borealis]|uniref:F-box domain-containing protein n=1 Tax=Armillaria borealis TaxID=47425 RepID=A0AA39MDJ9_9AGAR|nr:hypothetical protein EV421DRAFT_2025573 [Armillaria borealis]
MTAVGQVKNEEEPALLVTVTTFGASEAFSATADVFSEDRSYQDPSAVPAIFLTRSCSLPRRILCLQKIGYVWSFTDFPLRLLPQRCLDLENAKPTLHSTNETIRALIRDGRSAADLDSSYMNSLRQAIPLLESEVLFRDQERDLDNHKSILAPIRRLPDDLLLRIFKFASHGSGDQLSHPSHSRWALLRICHSWRVIALNSPTLWSVLAFNFVDWDICPPQHRTLFSRALDLSKNSSLDIQLNVDFFGTDGDEFLWETVAPTSSRWITCDLSSYTCYFQQFLDLFGNVPHLHTLRLEAGEDDDDYPWFEDSDEESPNFFSSAASLRVVEFRGQEFQHLSLPLHQLTKLSIHDTSQTGASSLFHECIARAVNLDTFSFHCKSEMITDAPLEPFVNQRIRKLTLVDCVPAKIQRPVPFSTIKGILLCSSGTLTDLVLTVDGESFSDTTQVLASYEILPSLRRLSMRYLRSSSKLLFADNLIYLIAHARAVAGLEVLTLSMPDSECWIQFDTPNHLARLRGLITCNFHIKFLYEGKDHFEEDSTDALIRSVEEYITLGDNAAEEGIAVD